MTKEYIIYKDSSNSIIEKVGESDMKMSLKSYTNNKKLPEKEKYEREKVKEKSEREEEIKKKLQRTNETEKVKGKK